MTAPLVLDFQEDWRQILAAKLAALGYTVNAADDLDGMSNKYFNTVIRRIPPRPRRVHESAEFDAKDRTGYYSELKARIEAGNDLTPHLSDRLEELNFNDGMLNEWGISHLHFGPGTPSRRSGYAERTKLILYAFVADDDFYSLQVLPHKRWSESELLRIIHRNWPQAIAKFRDPAIRRISHNPSIQERDKRRKSGIVSFAEIEPGVVYTLPGGGFTCDGTAARAVTSTTYYTVYVRNCEAHIKANMGKYLKAIAQAGLGPSNPPTFKLRVKGDDIVAMEEGTGISFPMFRNPLWP
jgi:hypothetical protein